MKEAIWSYLANTTGKMKTLLTCPLLAQPTTGAKATIESALGNSFHPWLQKTYHHVEPTAQKKSTPRIALISLRLLVVFMCLCISFLLTIAMQGMTTSPAMAAPATISAQAAVIPNLLDLFPQDSFCAGYARDEVPQSWNDAGLCATTITSGQRYARPSNGSCGQNELAVMTVTGQQDCVLTVPADKTECPVGFALDGGRCDYQPDGKLGWQVGLCVSFQAGQVPPQWIPVCALPAPDPETTFVQPSSGSCQQSWIKIMTRAGQEECVLALPTFKGQCPVGFALDGGQCRYQPQNSGMWHVGFCKSFTSDEVPAAWISSHACDTDPSVPDPQQTFVQQSSGACQPNWVQTMTLTGQQECVLTLPTLRGASCPIGFNVKDGRCQYVSQNSGGWQVGFCTSFTNDEIPPEWIASRICGTPSPDPQTTFLKPGPCQQYWIATTAESPQVQCLLTLPSVRGLCPIGFALDRGRCDYVPQHRTSWQAGFCQSFSSDEIPVEWQNNRICSTPSPDPETTFIAAVPCQPNWIETTDARGQVECILTIPSVRGLCPVGFALDGAKCDYVPKSKMTWVVGFCKSFNSDEVPPEWMSAQVCNTNPVPDPEQTFIKNGPCVNNWIRTAAEGGDTPKCALTVPAIKELCPIGFALNGASCDYVPRNTIGWQFPCSDRSDGTPNESAIATDWLSGDSPETQSMTSDPAVTDGLTGGRFVHTFAGDTYGLASVQAVFGYMLGFSFMLVTPMVILIGYQLMLAASNFRHAGALEGLSRVLLGGLAVGVSFQLVTMLISSANVISSAIVGLHGMLGYPATQIYNVKAAYTLAGVNEPLTSYRGMAMPISRWGCAVNDFIGILGTKFFSNQVTAWFPVIGNLSHLAVTVTNGADLISRVTEFARLVLSVVLWLQAVIRIGILNCYILTCPLAFACWSLPGGLGRHVLRQWMKGFLAVLFIQVGQLFLITTLPLVLPSFPAIVGDHQGITQVLLTQLPPLLVLWLTVRVPKLLGISATRAIGMTGIMAGGIVGAVGAAAGRLG